VFALIFIASLGDQVRFPDLVGASMLAGAAVLLVSVFGLTARVAAWLPAPIVLGVLAGAVLPYVTGIFTALSSEPLMIGTTFLAYLLGRRLLGARLPAVLPALVVGFIVAGLTGRFGQVSLHWPIPNLNLTVPGFSLQAIATATPVLVVLILVQSNLPTVIYLRSQGYAPSEQAIDAVSGAGTLLGSLLGPTAVSLALPLAPLAAGPDAGEFPVRHRTAYVAAAALILIGLLAGVAADLPTIIPLPLLLTLAGLSLVPVLATAFQTIARGPLLLGPLFAFAISLSKISLLGFGPFFWSLVFGILISWLLERKELSALRALKSR
jgi:benzoate membrane transport protein